MKKEESDDKLVLKNQGNAFFIAGNYKEAIYSYKKALLVDGKFKEAFCNMGQCYKELRLYDLALESFDKAIEVDPLYAKAVYNKAVILFSLGRINDGLKTVDGYVFLGGAEENIKTLQDKYSTNPYRNHIEITQASVARFNKDKTPLSISGFVTEGLFDCLAILIINQDKTRFSFIHTPPTVSLISLIAEVTWVGCPSNIHIIPGKNYTDGQRLVTLRAFVKALKAFLNTVSIKCDVFLREEDELTSSVCVDRAGNMKSIESSYQDKFHLIKPGDHSTIIMKSIGKVHQQIVVRHCLNLINTYALHLKESNQGVDIQYDQDHWNKLPSLTPSGSELLSNYLLGKVAVDACFKPFFNLYAEFMKNETGQQLNVTRH